MVASLTTAASGLFFDLDPFAASDIGQSHNIKFDICDPDAVQEQGSSTTAHCNFSWSVQTLFVHLSNSSL